MNHEKNKQSFLWNLKCKIQEHFKNKSLKTHYFKDFSRTTYNSRTFQGIQGIQEPLATLQLLCFLLYLDNFGKQCYWWNSCTVVQVGLWTHLTSWKSRKYPGLWILLHLIPCAFFVIPRLSFLINTKICIWRWSWEKIFDFLSSNFMVKSFQILNSSGSTSQAKMVPSKTPKQICIANPEIVYNASFNSWFMKKSVEGGLLSVTSFLSMVP